MKIRDLEGYRSRLRLPAWPALDSPENPWSERSRAMDLYTQDVDEARAAQGSFLAALEMPTQTIQ